TLEHAPELLSPYHRRFREPGRTQIIQLNGGCLVTVVPADPRLAKPLHVSLPPTAKRIGHRRTDGFRVDLSLHVSRPPFDVRSVLGVVFRSDFVPVQEHAPLTQCIKASLIALALLARVEMMN